MQIGFSQHDITPHANAFGAFRLSGVKRHSGVHDPLFAHALALRQDQQTCLLISLDVVAIPQAEADEAKARIARATGIEPAAILIAATHTHNGPETLNEEEDPRIRVWPAIHQALAAAATEAVGRLADGHVHWATRDLPIATNRYQHRLGQGGNTIDPQLDVLVFEGVNGEHLGALYHYAAHPTCAMAAEYRISGDYCALADRIIEERSGGFSMFFNGACGDINLEVGERTFARAEERAEEVAEAVLAATAGAKTAAVTELAWANQTVSVGIKRAPSDLVPPPQLGQWQDALEQARASEWQDVIADPERQRACFHQYQSYRTTLWKLFLRERFGERPTEDVPLQCIRMGPLVLVAIPGELFVEHQLRLQQRFPDQRVLIVGYANAYAGYIPTAEAMAHATYETQATLMHRVDGQAGDRLMAAATEMIQSELRV
jgi:neutral ceramidase